MSAFEPDLPQIETPLPGCGWAICLGCWLWLVILATVALVLLLSHL